MQRDDVWIAYNGEVYNFQEERQRLQNEGVTFKTRTDTEVLLALYLQHGVEFVERLRGIFAFALYDGRAGRLLCCRDHLGVKPLLYSFVDKTLVFASEFKALLASGLVSREINRQSLAALLRLGSVPQPATILRDVFSLMPGHMLLWENNTLTITPYWRMETDRLPLRCSSYPEQLEVGRELVSECLRLQLVADVPLGAFLSGGIDSSLLAALMQREHGNLRTFSVGFESDLDTASEDETNDAAIVARHLGCRHETIIVEQGDIVNSLSRIARDLDHPTVDGVNAWYVSRAAAGFLTVAISGTGGDELFAGYPWFRAMQDQPAYGNWLTRLCRRARPDDFLPRFAQQYGIFDPSATKSLCPDAAGEPPRLDPLPKALPLDRVTGLTLAGYTGNQLLFDIDTASMAHSLEVRVPLLDLKLLDFALSLPPSAKLGPGDPSAPLGSYAQTGVKRLLLDLGKDLLPPGFAMRAKRGFTLPFDGWLRSLLAPTCRDLFAESVLRRRGYFEPNAASRVWDSFLAHGVHWTQPWLLLMVELWAQNVLDA